MSWKVWVPIPVAVLIALIALFVGSVSVAPGDILAVIWEGVSGTASDRDLTVARLIVSQVRLPRVLVAAGAGGALSLAGLFMQTVFRNPLAGPGVLGVSAGASLGVALVLMTGIGAQTSAPAFLAAMIGAAGVLLLAMSANRIVGQPIVLLVLGLLFGYAANAMTTLLMATSPAEGIQRYVVWSFGSFARPPGFLPVALPVVAAGTAVVVSLFASRLDALLLGPHYAESTGIHAKRLQGVLILLAGALTGLVTAMTGPIAFLGVAVPHLARGYLRSSIHRVLVPTVALLGAILAILADLVARLPGSDRVLPLNAVMALIGVPVVLIVILRPSGSGTVGELEL